MCEHGMVCRYGSAQMTNGFIGYHWPPCKHAVPHHRHQECGNTNYCGNKPGESENFDAMVKLWPSCTEQAAKDNN